MASPLFLDADAQYPAADVALHTSFASHLRSTFDYPVKRVSYITGYKGRMLRA